MAKRVRLLASLLKQGVKLLKQGVKLIFTATMEGIVRDLLLELSAPPTLVFPGWDAAVDASRPLRLHCDIVVLASMARFVLSCVFSAQRWNPSGTGPPSILKQEVSYGALNVSAVIRQKKNHFFLIIKL